MITNAIIFTVTAVLNVLTLPIRLLPDVSLPADITDAIIAVKAPFGMINTIFPVDVVLAIFILFLTVELAFFAYKLIMWVIHRIPFMG